MAVDRKKVQNKTINYLMKEIVYIFVGNLGLMITIQS